MSPVYRRSHVYSRRSRVYSRRSPVYSRRSSVYNRRSNTKLLWTSMGPKYEKKSPGFDKIIVLIMKDE